MAQRKERLLAAGTRVRLKNETILGWRGIGEVVRHWLGGVVVIKKEGSSGEVTCAYEELSVLR